MPYLNSKGRKKTLSNVVSGRLTCDTINALSQVNGMAVVTNPRYWKILKGKKNIHKQVLLGMAHK